MGRNHLRIKAIERREEGGVDLSRRDALAAEALRPRRARIAEQRYLVAEVRGLPHARVDAHVRHHSGDHQLLHAGRLQHLLEVRGAEAVGKVLLDDSLTGIRPHALMDLRAGRAGYEERGPGPCRKVAHMHDWQSLAAKLLDGACGVARGSIGTL